MSSINCAQCSKNIMFHKGGYRDWIWKRDLCDKGWKYIKRIRMWVCPACKMLPQYDQKNKRVLLKELMK